MGAPETRVPYEHGGRGQGGSAIRRSLDTSSLGPALRSDARRRRSRAPLELEVAFTPHPFPPSFGTLMAARGSGPREA